MNTAELEKAKELYDKYKMDAESIKVNSIAIKICEEIEEFLRIFEDYEEESLVPYDGFLKNIKYRLEGNERNELKKFVGQMEGPPIYENDIY